MRLDRRLVTSCGALLFAAVACVVHAQPPTGEKQQFVQTAIQSSVDELALSELGAGKASDPVLKQFAVEAIRRQELLLVDLRSLANSIGGVTTRPERSEASSKQYASMKRQSGGAFDKAFLQALVQALHGDLNRYFAESKQTRDRDYLNALSKAGHEVAVLTIDADSQARRFEMAVPPMPAGSGPIGPN